MAGGDFIVWVGVICAGVVLAGSLILRNRGVGLAFSGRWELCGEFGIGMGLEDG